MFNSSSSCITARPRSCCAASVHSRQVLEHTRCHNAALSVPRVHCLDPDSLLSLADDVKQHPLPVVASATYHDRGPSEATHSLLLPQQDARRSHTTTGALPHSSHSTTAVDDRFLTWAICNCSSIAKLRHFVDSYLDKLNHIHVAAALCKLPKLIEALERDALRASTSAAVTAAASTSGRTAQPHAGTSRQQLQHQQPPTQQQPVSSWWGIGAGHHLPTASSHVPSAPPWPGQAESSDGGGGSSTSSSSGDAGGSSTSTSSGSGGGAGSSTSCSCSTPSPETPTAAGPCYSTHPPPGPMPGTTLHALPAIATAANSLPLPSIAVSISIPSITPSSTPSSATPPAPLLPQQPLANSPISSSDSSSSSAGTDGLASSSSRSGSSSTPGPATTSTATTATALSIPPSPTPRTANPDAIHLLATLLPLLHTHLPHLGPRELCNCTWALAKLYPPIPCPSHPSPSPTAPTSYPQMPSPSPTHPTSIPYPSPDPPTHPLTPPALPAIITHLLTHRKLWAANGVELSMLAWALATLRYPHPTLYPALAHLAAARAPSLDPQALSNISWALATIHCLPEPTLHALASCAASRLTTHPALFTPQHLANIAWAHARACRFLPGLHCTRSVMQLFASVAAAAAPQLHHHQPHGLTSLAWAFAIVQPPEARWFVAAAATALVACSSGSSSSSRGSSAGSGGGSSGGDSGEGSSRDGSGAGSDSSSSGGIRTGNNGSTSTSSTSQAAGDPALLVAYATSLWACVRCGVRHQPLADAACGALLAVGEERCGARVLTTLAWSLAMLGVGWRHPAFRRVVALCGSRAPAAAADGAADAQQRRQEREQRQQPQGAPPSSSSSSAAAEPAAEAEDGMPPLPLPHQRPPAAACPLVPTRPPPHPPPRPAPELAPGTPPQRRPLHASQVSVVLWAAARARAPPSAPPLTPLLAQARPTLRACYPQELAQLAWACAALRLRDRPTLHALSLAAAHPRTLTRAKPRELSNLLYALRSLHALHPQLALAAARALTPDSLAFYKPEELAKLAVGLSGVPALAPVVRHVAREARREMGTQFSVASVAVLLGALAEGGVYDGPLMDMAAERVVACQARLRPWQAQRIGDACERLGYHHDQLLWVCEQVLRAAVEEEA